MKYFLLLLCVFYTMEGLAQVVPSQYEKYQVDFGQEIAVRRSNVRTVRRHIREEDSLTNEERQQYLRAVGEVLAIVQPPSPPRNPSKRRRRHGRTRGVSN